MGFRSFAQGLLALSCAGLGVSAMSIRATISDVQPLPSPVATALAQGLAMPVSTAEVHRRVYAYRLDGLLSSKHALHDIFGCLPAAQSPSTPTAVAAAKDAVAAAQPPLSPSLSSLFALHAIETALPFRAAWMWRTFWSTYRVSDTFNVWWRSRPAWMSHTVRRLIEESPGVPAREAAITDAAEEVGQLTHARYTAAVVGKEPASGGGVVCRWTPAPAQQPPGAEEGDDDAEERRCCVASWGVRFAAEEAAPAAEQLPPRGVPLYVVYVSAPYASGEGATSLTERARRWKDAWYSRWFAARVASSLTKM